MSKRSMTLEEKYQKKVLPDLVKKYKNVMAVPKVKAVFINIGFGKDLAAKGSDEQRKFIENVSQDLALITGQKPALTQAKKSISGFKLRQGMPMGLKITLRKKRMFGFLDNLINIALPRSRDFKGLSRESFDNQGNLNIGIKEQIIFPEVSAEQLKNIFSFQITIKTTAKTKEQGMELLTMLGFPIKK
jgi:large subunit ribosomal protein L5